MGFFGFGVVGFLGVGGFLGFSLGFPTGCSHLARFKGKSDFVGEIVSGGIFPGLMFLGGFRLG